MSPEQTEAVDKAFARVTEIGKSAKTPKAVLHALTKVAAGYGFLHAVHWVDAEVRNGGLEQLFRNTGGAEIPLAIDGLSAMKRGDLADLLRESLASAQARFPELMADSLQDVPEMPGARTWGQLDRAYLSLAQKGLVESYATLLKSAPQLFEPQFVELKHPDGRGWKVRASGSTVQIQIVLEDGSIVDRERKQSTAAAAQREMQNLIDEMLKDGFVKTA